MVRATVVLFLTAFVLFCLAETDSWEFPNKQLHGVSDDVEHKRFIRQATTKKTVTTKKAGTTKKATTKKSADLKATTRKQTTRKGATTRKTTIKKSSTTKKRTASWQFVLLRIDPPIGLNLPDEDYDDEDYEMTTIPTTIAPAESLIDWNGGSSLGSLAMFNRYRFYYYRPDPRQNRYFKRFGFGSRSPWFMW